MTFADDIPYVNKLHHRAIEAGQVISEDLLHLLQHVPHSNVTTYFKFNFSLKNGYIPGSSAELTIDRERRRLGLREFSFYNSKVEDVLKGGQLEKLSLAFPGSNSQDTR